VGIKKPRSNKQKLATGPTMTEKKYGIQGGARVADKKKRVSVNEKQWGVKKKGNTLLSARKTGQDRSDRKRGGGGGGVGGGGRHKGRAG